MKDIEKIKKKLEKTIPFLRKKYKVCNMGIFGSYIKGEENKESDLDILIEFESSADFGILDFVKIENYLTDLLKIKVDLVEKSSLKPRIGKQILKEVINV